jgi:beta-glucosidase
MVSYNRINNSYATQNSKIINGLLKTELGYQGWTVSDWGAQHSGIESALAGLDQMMPACYDFWGTNLSQAVTNGSVSQARVDDMVTRSVKTAPYLTIELWQHD